MVWAYTQTKVMVFVIDGFKSIHVVGFDYIWKSIFFSKRVIFFHCINGRTINIIFIAFPNS